MIDQESARPGLFGKRVRLRDLEALLRGAPVWGGHGVRALLAAYLAQPAGSTLVDTWLQRLMQRRHHKEAR